MLSGLQSYLKLKGKQALQFVENEIQVTVYADNNISKVQAQNLWSNKVTSIFIDDPTEYI